jgi:excisionase family DNA binding protein
LEVANICGVVNQTAINWIRNGHLKAFTTPGGQYRIYAKDLAAFLDKRGMSDSGEALQVMMENANWNSILIAAGDKLTGDSLKTEIGKLFPDYEILQAFNWFEVGRKLTEEKPGFVLVDAGLPGFSIAKFIHAIKNDIFFGKPHVFLMTDGDACGDMEPSEYESEYEGADAVFPKPLDMGKFESLLRGLEKQADPAVIA